MLFSAAARREAENAAVELVSMRRVLFSLDQLLSKSTTRLQLFSRQADTGGSKLRHIDLCQQWSTCCGRAVWLPACMSPLFRIRLTMLTKALDHTIFKRLWDELMHLCPS